jgi:ribonucleoside-triphosphate reductase (thioredoxin)
MNSITSVQKRNGLIVTFDLNRVSNAIYKAMMASSEGSQADANELANNVLCDLEKIVARHKSFLPTVEGVQDAVETELMDKFPATAKTYILYRDKRSKARQDDFKIPARVQKLAEASKQYFRNPLNEFVYLRTYARWIEEEGRRETWIETVDRYMDFMHENLGDKLTTKEYDEVRAGILRQDIMPSMRLLQFAGKAAKKTNVCAYNCSYIAPCSLEDFAEVMYISMCGTGVGFSVESKNVQALPQIKLQTGKTLAPFVIKDSKEGWCDAFLKGLKTWFNGKDVAFDYTELRPAGARLKTFGGKSSGPDPLRALLDFSREKILAKQGRRLNNLDVHDILCKIGEVVVSGGVRRSAMMSLSDLDDVAMRDAKKGQFYYNEPQRSIANNSAVYESKPSASEFLREWTALVESGSGERGIFNRGNLMTTLPPRRIKHWQEKEVIQHNQIVECVGTNPCGEIILRSKQFCNLSEVIGRPEDTEASLLRKIRLATILGTYQASLTQFSYLSEAWKENCEAERLLGISITGQWDCKASRDPNILTKLKRKARLVNQEYAKRFEMNEATCITCVKPSGTVSQMVDCASGMHPKHSPYYIRRIRIAATDALFKMLREQGVIYHPEVGQTMDNATTFVLEFPMKSPEGSIYKSELNAIDQLEHWKLVKENFTEHNPSVTILVGEDEWVTVANWVYSHWSIVGGLSFLPRSNHVYQLTPYEEIDEQRYHEMCKHLENLDFSRLMAYEMADETDIKRELACVGGHCEL